MKKALAFALLLGTAVGVPASASAAPAVTVEFSDGVLWDDCFQVPINLSIVGDNPPATRYVATVTLRDPEGFREEFQRLGSLRARLPESSGRLPKVPERVRTTFQAFRKLPDMFPKAPEALRKLPERFPKHPEGFGKCAEEFPKRPEGSPKLPEELRKFPERFGKLRKSFRSVRRLLRHIR